MKTKILLLAASAAGALGLLPQRAEATWMQQTISLEEGWNAVHVKVNPYAYGCDAVFGGGGISQVTWYNFDHRDDGTGSVSSESYSWYAGKSAPEGNTFGAVLGGERYEVFAVAKTNLVIVGTPALPRGSIHLSAGGRGNLLGLNVPDDPTGMNLNDYFQHYGSLATTPYWRKKTDGEIIAQTGGTALTDPNRAFWVYAVGTGTETYMGPLEVAIDSAEKILSWVNSSSARTLSVKNVTSASRIVRFEMEDSLNPPAGQGAKAGKAALKIETVDWSKGYARRVYTPVSFPFTTNLAAGATFNFKIRPNLDALPATTAGDYLGILAISDKGATDAYGTTFANGTCLYRVGVKVAGGLAASKSPSGLWVGTVALNGVNRAQMLSSAKPEWDVENIQDTTQAFQFRLILHAADDGGVKLMKQAFVGSQSADNELAAVIADKATAKQFRAKYPKATIRRVSSANFPFMEPKAFDNPLNFLKDGGSMSVSFTQYYDAKDNPFLHQFHPNHDNLAFNNGKPSYKEDGAAGTGDYESWNVTRKVTLTFAGQDPLGDNDDWNRTMCGGVYREEIRGLNKTPIIVQGAFRLSKTLDTPEVQSGGVAW